MSVCCGVFRTLVGLSLDRRSEICRLMAKPATHSPDGSPSKQKKHNMVAQAILCLLCTLIGAFYPTLLDMSKTATQFETRSVQDGGHFSLVTQEKRVYPFSATSVVLINDAIQLAIALVAVSGRNGLSAVIADAGLILKMMPLGMIYAVGELLTLRSVEKGSGPVYVVIANMKLVVAALMSRAFFGKSRSLPCLHWMELILISLAAAAYTLCEAGSLGSQWHWDSAWAALAKSSLVAFSSVFCEHTYKSNPFMVVLTLQAFWGVATMLFLVGASYNGMLGSLGQHVAAELRDEDGAFTILGGGPGKPLCSSAAHAACLQQIQSGAVLACTCMSSRGWDAYTLLTVVADLSNAISSALVFRRLSAVAKYVCRASSAVPMYIFYCSIGRSAWDVRTFGLVLYLCGQVGVYTVQRNRAEAELELAQDAAWVTSYKEGGSAEDGLRQRK